jgi:hypothetical protein
VEVNDSELDDAANDDSVNNLEAPTEMIKPQTPKPVLKPDGTFEHSPMDLQ